MLPTKEKENWAGINKRIFFHWENKYLQNMPRNWHNFLLNEKLAGMDGAKGGYGVSLQRLVRWVRFHRCSSYIHGPAYVHFFYLNLIPSRFLQFSLHSLDYLEVPSLSYVRTRRLL